MSWTIQDITAIILSACAIIGVIISSFTLRNKIKNEVKNLNTMISMKNNNSQGNTNNYQNCQFYDTVKSKQSIKDLRENE